MKCSNGATSSADASDTAKAMSKNPKIIGPDEMAVDAVKVMKKHDISSILVLDQGIYQGIIHFQDLLKEGLI